MLRIEDKEKIDAFFASLTKEQLTEKLIESGVDFYVENEFGLAKEFSFDILYSTSAVRCQAEEDQYIFETFDGATA